MNIMQLNVSLVLRGYFDKTNSFAAHFDSFLELDLSIKRHTI